MDKMGSSIHAKNKGIPATSRNGAPIELVGLLKYCLDAYANLNEKGYYSHQCVTYKEKKISYRDWGSYIQTHFERWFWIPQDPNEKTHHSIEE
jgi:glycogen debranching enzyme